MVALTIGMATYDDFDGVYFTIQSLRLHHDLTETEILVIDNYGCNATETFVTSVPNARYVQATEVVGTAVRELVFAHARGEAVLCVDSHILFPAGTIARLRDYYAAHTETRDLLQGPLLYDDLKSLSTHFEPEWRSQMWGTWGTDPRGLDPDGEAFDIPSQGLGVFSCRRDAWPGFNPAFRGFGGEEGYIHEKFRQRGGRTLCLPWLRWAHRFGRPKGVPYPLTVEMKLRNYIIGLTELGLDTAEAEAHFSEFLSAKRVAKVKAEALAEYARSVLPLISCICVLPGQLLKKRIHIEEAIHSFLLQDYPNKELIVLNTGSGLDLACDAPGVRVVSLEERFGAPSEDLDAAMAVADGDLVTVWEVDSISLPWRLSISFEFLGDADYFTSHRAWEVQSGETLSEVEADTSLFRRDALREPGGLSALQRNEHLLPDTAIRLALQSRGNREAGEAELPREDWFTVIRGARSERYRQANSSSNASRKSGRKLGKHRRIVLNPHWRKDYLAAVEDHLRASTRIAVLGEERRGLRERLPFKRDDQQHGESVEQHLERVRELVAESMIRGATHLLIPRQEADWIGNHAHLEEYFSREHDFTDAGQDLGLVFALRGPAHT